MGTCNTVWVVVGVSTCCNFLGKDRHYVPIHPSPYYAVSTEYERPLAGKAKFL